MERLEQIGQCMKIPDFGFILFYTSSQVLMQRLLHYRRSIPWENGEYGMMIPLKSLVGDFFAIWGMTKPGFFAGLYTTCVKKLRLYLSTTSNDLMLNHLDIDITQKHMKML